MSTTNQKDSAEWYPQRRKRLTASNFYFILRVTCLNSVYNLVKSMTSLVQSYHKATQHGNTYEPVALAQFENDEPKYKVEKIGLNISIEYPEFGASPDGVLVDRKSRRRVGLIEVKCPFGTYDYTLK